MAKKEKAVKTRRKHMVKKCPECFEYLPLNVKRCPSCKTKLTDVDPRTGLSKKPVDVKAYFMSIVSFAALALFIWWAFFRLK